PYVALEIGLPQRADAAERPPQHPSRAPGEHIGAVERDGRERNLGIVERDALPNTLYLRLEGQRLRYRDRVASLDRAGQFASADIVGVTTDRRWITLDIGPLQHRVDIPVRRTKMGPIAGVAGGIEIDMTGECTVETIDRAMDTARCAGVPDIEADMVAVAVAARQPQQHGPSLETGQGAVEVRPCPLRKVLARVLTEHTAPCTDLHIATQEKLIALALVKCAERD